MEPRRVAGQRFGTQKSGRTEGLEPRGYPGARFAHALGLCGSACSSFPVLHGAQGVFRVLPSPGTRPPANLSIVLQSVLVDLLSSCKPAMSACQISTCKLELHDVCELDSRQRDAQRSALSV